MKKTLLLLVLCLGTFGLFAQKNDKKANKPTIELKNAIDSANYAYGVIVASNVQRQMGSDFNNPAFMEAFMAAMKGDSVAINLEKSSKLFSEYNRTAQVRSNEKNKAEGRKFLEANKTRKGVTTTASGLQYEVLKRGTGTTSPKETDKVEVHYHGTLTDGTVFDSSVERGQPASFGLNQVIKGWTEGLQLMKIGDKFKFFLPYEIAYGERSAGPKIKPFSALVFEVELLKIN
jgi:FKBP-type peptidyl-prolyl cis-trans isomerase